MSKTANLTLGEKIREIRKFVGMSQANLAKATKRGIGTISRIENGQAECSGELLKDVRKALDIKNAPLLEGEDITFHERLHVWRDLINARSLHEAREMRKDLANILHLPFERDLMILYMIYDAKLLMAENDVVLAAKRLDFSSLEEMSSENLYHYYFTKGSLLTMHRQYKDALAYFLKAYNLDRFDLEKESSLLYNIAICYGSLCMPCRSIMYLERSCNQFKNERASILGLRIENALAVSYMHIGENNLAQKLLGKCLIRAKSTNNRIYTGIASLNLGSLCLKTDRTEQALGYYNQAFEYFEEGDFFYLENLYYKIRCLIKLGKLSQCKELLQDAKNMAGQNENHMFLFNSLDHLMNLKDPSSCQYLKDTAIPYMLDIYEYYKALDYCKLLEDNYKNKRQTKKALEVAALMRDIYERAIFIEDD